MNLWNEMSENKEETILQYYLDRARALRMLYYKTGNKKYEKAAMKIASEGRKQLEQEQKTWN